MKQQACTLFMEPLNIKCMYAKLRFTFMPDLKALVCFDGSGGRGQVMGFPELHGRKYRCHGMNLPPHHFAKYMQAMCLRALSVRKMNV